MMSRMPAPVVCTVEHKDETWQARRHGRFHYEVVAELHHGPIKLFVASYRWLRLAKRRCRKGGE